MAGKRKGKHIDLGKKEEEGRGNEGIGERNGETQGME